MGTPKPARRLFTVQDVERVNGALQRLREKYKAKFGHERGWRKTSACLAELDTRMVYYFKVAEGVPYSPALDRLIDLSYLDDPFSHIKKL